MSVSENGWYTPNGYLNKENHDIHWNWGYRSPNFRQTKIFLTLCGNFTGYFFHKMPYWSTLILDQVAQALTRTRSIIFQAPAVNQLVHPLVIMAMENHHLNMTQSWNLQTAIYFVASDQSLRNNHGVSPFNGLVYRNSTLWILIHTELQFEYIRICLAMIRQKVARTLQLCISKSPVSFRLNRQVA